MTIEFDLNKQQHKVEFEVPAVKLWIFTIRKAYTERRFIDCECGDYNARDELIKGVTKPNAILESLKQRQVMAKKSMEEHIAKDLFWAGDPMK